MDRLFVEHYILAFAEILDTMIISASNLPEDTPVLDTPLGHLHNALLHHFPSQSPPSPPASTPSIIPVPPTSSLTLLPEILPHVMQHLYPRTELLTLLTVQRVSKHGWDLATPLIYRDVTIRNWYSVLRTPRGLLPNEEA